MVSRLGFADIRLKRTAFAAEIPDFYLIIPDLYPPDIPDFYPLSFPIPPPRHSRESGNPEGGGRRCVRLGLYLQRLPWRVFESQFFLAINPR